MSSIARKPHCLKREKTLAMPRHIIFFDCETEQEKLPNGSIRQKLKLGWAVYYRKGYGRNLIKTEWHNFNDALSFWQFVYRHTEKKRKLWVLARNLVFDFTVVEGWKYLRQVGFKLKFFHDEGTTSIISVKGRFGSIVFLDIMNYFVESLAKTGERIGIPKLKIDFETCTDEYLNIYCKRDVEIELDNFKRLIKFLEANSVARLCYTRGSTAMAAYLLRHYQKRIYIHNNEQAIELERDSYRGGRTECFYLGELKDDNFYILDVNSLYPMVMRNNLYPVKYISQTHKIKVEALRNILKDRSVIAEVLIDTDEPVYAVRRGRTIFPIGRFWVTLTTPELLYALEHNHLIKVERAVIYEQTNIFKTYVDRFYKLRQEFKTAGVAEYEELCKKMLNSLYGKFGQKAEIWEKIGDCPNEPDRVELCFEVGVVRVKQIRYLLGEIFELKGHTECFNSFPAIPAQVSAYARLYLWGLMQLAGEGNYFYCDTDSLIVNEAGLCRLQNRIDDTNLGSLRVVSSPTNIVIRGLKDYSAGTKQVIKGIRRNAVEKRDGVYEQEQWPSFKGLLRTGQTDVYTVKKVTKVLNRKYTKGHVTTDGSIVPLVLGESDDYAPLFY
ncbi:unnamed protein product [marine sediment metagenome]|uniref:DNA-directed DNA polymerase n=1 Tax=marine sediment metagenome TaxID=412755 RepID=X1SJ70_9ZZZZ